MRPLLMQAAAFVARALDAGPLGDTVHLDLLNLNLAAYCELDRCEQRCEGVNKGGCEHRCAQLEARPAHSACALSVPPALCAPCPHCAHVSSTPPLDSYSAWRTSFLRTKTAHILDVTARRAEADAPEGAGGGGLGGSGPMPMLSPLRTFLLQQQERRTQWRRGVRANFAMINEQRCARQATFVANTRRPPAPARLPSQRLATPSVCSHRLRSQPVYSHSLRRCVSVSLTVSSLHALAEAPTHSQTARYPHLCSHLASVHTSVHTSGADRAPRRAVLHA